MDRFLAIDIGASSGRHIVGWIEDGKTVTDEVFRFPNGVEKVDGHLVWNIEGLVENVRKGIEIAIGKYNDLRSFSIDTWGVDYVLMKGDKEILPCYSYRDSRTDCIIDEVHSIIPFDELYSHTGCQFLKFNTIYQLYADKKAGRLSGATDFLMIPEYIMYRLCDVKVKEYTNSTTTGLICAKTGEFDLEIISRLGFPKPLFCQTSAPGTVIGNYRGLDAVLCATHDTASAVEGIPMGNESVFISSGTWSLLGVKTPKPMTDSLSLKANFSNEGGVGYNRYLKNIMGMWVVNNLKTELCPSWTMGEVVESAVDSTVGDMVDVNSDAFLAPASMKKAFDDALGFAFEKPGDYFRCAYLSLAKCYAKAIAGIENTTGVSYKDIYIVGGGAKNTFLNDLTAFATGKKVVALPIEATALGNLKIQMEAFHDKI